ncbi:hypothetical protein SAMN02787100_1367 [Chryseobacterium sp. OV279]|nr:hypothetical protein SAMN02787100_1367 [Chryseobacterium sp. OV279]
MYRLKVQIETEEYQSGSLTSAISGLDRYNKQEAAQNGQPLLFYFGSTIIRWFALSIICHTLKKYVTIVN